MPHVTSQVRRVYRAGSRTFLTSHAAYYSRAKMLVAEKYPRELTGDGAQGYDSDEEIGWFMSIPEGLVEERRQKRVALFYRLDCDNEGEDRSYFDSDKWSAFCRRVARFLRHVDRCEAARAADMLDRVIRVMAMVAAAVAVDRQIGAWRSGQ